MVSGRGFCIRLLLRGCSVLLCALTSCNLTHQQRSAPVTIRIIGSGPLTLRQLEMRPDAFSKFTQETGILVEYIPGPESSTERLGLYQRTLGRQSTTPDVYLIDAVWPAILAEDLVDLRPWIGGYADQQLSQDVRNDTVDGKLVAMPSSIERGVLYYRTDLLSKYGYKHPPNTWDELEHMAARIQAGERRAGNRNFWGFVWQGDAYEGLTCNALEWQASQGGGRIIEPDGTISVNNPGTIAALERARHWIGTISPPSVIAYKEEDSRNAFESGNAAFRRDWVWTVDPTHLVGDSPIKGRFSVAPLPGGATGRVSVIGGWALSVSKYSRHPHEASLLVHYLTSDEGRARVWKENQSLPAQKAFYAYSGFSAAHPELAVLKDTFVNEAVARPSTVTGAKYAEVSRAYFSAVHSVLEGKETSAKAIGDLDVELQRITGLKSRKLEASMTVSAR